jgi:hypothetical protein
MGRLQRRFGLTIDNLLAAEVVTADGRLVRASEDENPDLFWGLRGAGANFGIVTAFEFRLHPLDGVITHGSLVHPIERADELGALFREAVDATPDELWLGFALALALPAESFPPEVAGKPIAVVNVLHSGQLEDAERDLARLRAFGPPVLDSIEAKPYLATQTMNDDAMAWGHRFYMKSAFVPDLPDDLIGLLAGHVPQVPDGADGSITAWACGRAIARVPEEATAFTGREAAHWVAAEIFWDDAELDDRCREWARTVIADVLPFATTGVYVNDVAEAGADVASVYGDAKLERLVGVKRAWDPDNVFRLNQNVPP